MKKLRSLLVLTVALVAPLTAHGGGLGWYYESFSWSGFQTYFGGGTTQEKAKYHRHLESLLQRERKAPYYNIEFTANNVEMWRSFIDTGLHYQNLTQTETRFADEVLSIVMGPEAGLVKLDVKSHTAPDYIAPGSFPHLFAAATPEAQDLLLYFKFGRSFGEQRGRAFCVERGMAWQGAAWHCYEAHVILSPKECSVLGKHLLSILRSSSFQESEFEERKYVTPFAKALVAAGRRKRGMYVHTTD